MIGEKLGLFFVSRVAPTAEQAPATLEDLELGKRIYNYEAQAKNQNWMAPFMIIGRGVGNIFRWPSLHLKVDPGSCKHCQTCTEGCPMSLPVQAMVQRSDMENSECVLCGTCVDNCEQGAIWYSFKPSILNKSFGRNS